MRLLLDNVAKFVDLNKEEERILMESFVIDKYPAKSFLLKEGEICKDNVFVLSGILKNYTIDDELKEHTVSFASRGWWSGDMYSFISQKPGNSFIVALEDTTVMKQTRVDQLRIFDKIPKMERFSRILIERSLVATQQRMLNNMQLSAEECYLRFMERYPDIKYKIPQKDIASYLGITPQFFSKMKARMLRSKSKF